MSSERPDDVFIFKAARKIESSSDPTASFEGNCGNDSELRARIAGLLATLTDDSEFPKLLRVHRPPLTGRFRSGCT